MIASRLPRGLALVVVLLSAGCFRPPVDPPPVGSTHVYPEDLSHPDSLLKQLEACYDRKELDHYLPLLAPEFEFVFDEDDVTPDIPLGYWNFEEDSTATRALFESRDVDDIRIDLTRDSPQEVELKGRTVQRVFVSFTDLNVDQTNGITLQVNGDQQYFYFRRGLAGSGEVPSRWYIIRWEDLGQGGGGVGAPGRAQPASVEETVDGRRIEHVSMSALRARPVTR